MRIRPDSPEGFGRFADGLRHNRRCRATQMMRGFTAGHCRRNFRDFSRRKVWLFKYNMLELGKAGVDTQLDPTPRRRESASDAGPAGAAAREEAAFFRKVLAKVQANTQYSGHRPLPRNVLPLARVSMRALGGPSDRARLSHPGRDRPVRGSASPERSRLRVVAARASRTADTAAWHPVNGRDGRVQTASESRNETRTKVVQLLRLATNVKPAPPGRHPSISGVAPGGREEGQ